MPFEIIAIGPSPCEETCAQVGQSDYEERSRRECRIFQRMLERLLPVPHDIPVQYVVKSFPHDFGSYREVCVRYDDTEARACAHAYTVESNSPAEWDAIASYELIWLERRQQLQQAVHCGELRPEEMPAVYCGALPALPADRSFNELLEAFPL